MMMFQTGLQALNGSSPSIQSCDGRVRTIFTSEAAARVWELPAAFDCRVNALTLYDFKPLLGAKAALLRQWAFNDYP